MSETGSFGCLGHSNWTICIPLSHFCLGNFQKFPLSYWEANSYYPRGLIVKGGEIFQFQSWMTQGGLGAWGIQTGPFAALWANFVLAIFSLLHLNTRRPFVINPEGFKWERGLKWNSFFLHIGDLGNCDSDENVQRELRRTVLHVRCQHNFTFPVADALFRLDSSVNDRRERLKWLFSQVFKTQMLYVAQVLKNKWGL